MNNLVNNEWYQQMVEECKSVIVEHDFTSRWALVEGYHALGKRILEEEGNFERSHIYGGEIVSRVSESLQKSPRTVWRSIQFARKYPDLNTLPVGKNISWHSVCNKFLPEPPGKEDQEQQGLVTPEFKKSTDDLVMAAANLTELIDIVDVSDLRDDEKDYLFSQLEITVGKVGRFLFLNDPDHK